MIDDVNLLNVPEVGNLLNVPKVGNLLNLPKVGNLLNVLCQKSIIGSSWRFNFHLSKLLKSCDAHFICSKGCFPK